MTSPLQIPIHIRQSEAILTPETIRKLFGASCLLTGTEKVRLLSRGASPLSIRCRTGEQNQLWVDAHLLGQLDASAVYLQGPEGTTGPLSPTRIPRRLHIPKALLKAWKLTPYHSLSIQAGSIILTQVKIHISDSLFLEIDPTDAAAADFPTYGRLIPAPQATAESHNSPAPSDYPRLITENDVRKARMRRQKIRLRKGQLITPSARMLAQEWGLLITD